MKIWENLFFPLGIVRVKKKERENLSLVYLWRNTWEAITAEIFFPLEPLEVFLPSSLSFSSLFPHLFSLFTSPPVPDCCLTQLCAHSTARQREQTIILNICHSHDKHCVSPPRFNRCRWENKEAKAPAFTNPPLTLSPFLYFSLSNSPFPVFSWFPLPMSPSFSPLLCCFFPLFLPLSLLLSFRLVVCLLSPSSLPGPFACKLSKENTNEERNKNEKKRGKQCVGMRVCGCVRVRQRHNESLFTLTITF